MPVTFIRVEPSNLFISPVLLQVNTLDVSNGLTIELNPDVFEIPGKYSLIRFTQLIGSLSQVQFINNTIFQTEGPFLVNNTIVMRLR